ncbi:PspA/IM30 family protein (plasmid) [Rhizobium sp. CB3171]|uniref:PspA/IM30 family protein n=1 Tax=unclassified Rhizobium TaxID=2613769 RepID=UPI000CDF3974|nr:MULTISPECIES: PspA/IM30 family protein [Rhizobium]AVA26625.1 PspA/IM30 family protein [Rhizobium sp. NXC24]UWU24358.1 PspA/IM30 family protein [Rhizobium tropici]WFU05338.1 PspA/IM30 family protein [Rhizobium sp. CB3171]
MFNSILTLIRGRAYDAEQAFIDRNAVPLLAQQIRDAASAIQSARRAVAVAIAQNEQEKSQHMAITARIADLETRAIAALQKGSDELAREAAEAIAQLEAERDASEKAQAQFIQTIGKLKATVRASEARLQQLQRGERLARATEQTQKLNAVSDAAAGLVTLDEAEETLARLQAYQNRCEITASAMKEMDAASRPEIVIEKLASAGFGAPLGPSADGVLARLRERMNSAA